MRNMLCGRCGSAGFAFLILCYAAPPPISAAQRSPQDTYREAVAYMQKGDWEQAVSRLQAVVRAVPGNARLHNTLGIALSSAGRPVEAAEQFERALAIDPAYPSALKNLALHEMARDRFDAAETHFEHLLRVVPEDPMARLGLAEIAYARGDFATAVPHFEAGQELLPKDPRLLIDFSKALQGIGQSARAARTLRRMPAAAPPQMHFHTALMLAGLEQYEDAAREFELARGGAEPYELGFNLTLALLKSGRFERAVDTAEELVEQGRGSAELHNLLSRAYRETGDIKNAYDALRRATEIDPGAASNYIDLIALCLDHENFDLGLEIADISVERVPNSDRLHLQRGVALAMKGRFEDAQKAFNEAGRLAPKKNLPGVAMGLILMQRGPAARSGSSVAGAPASGA